MLTLATAQAALAAHATANVITAQQVMQQLQTVRGVTFANVTQVTKVATAAAHRAVNIQKVSVANVQLFNTVNDYSAVYAAAVKRSAAKLDATQDTSNYTPKEAWFAHDAQCFSIVYKKTDPAKTYLYAIYNNAASLLFIDNVQATKQQVAQYLTASAARDLLDTSNVVTNVEHGFMHTVQLRAVELCNIVAIKAAKQVLTV
jgi:hypothetical protein